MALTVPAGAAGAGRSAGADAPRTPSPRWGLVRVAVALLALSAAALLLPGIGVGLAYLAPAALLAFPLLRHRYVGERQLARLSRRGRRTVARRARALPQPRPSRAPRVLVPRSGRLIACSLASRPPPRAATAAA